MRQAPITLRAWPTGSLGSRTTLTTTRPRPNCTVYLANRHRFEAQYDALSDAQRAALAIRYGASYVVAAAPSSVEEAKAKPAPPLELVHVEGRVRGLSRQGGGAGPSPSVRSRWVN